MKACLLAVLAGSLWAGPGQLDARLQKMVERHAEPGWQKDWTIWLSRGIGGYVSSDGKTAWYQIRMSQGFADHYCPGYNRLKPEGKRDFLIELFKAVSWAESNWDPSVGAEPGPQGLFQMNSSDMESCARATASAPTGDRIRTQPKSPRDAIACAVFKLMPVFYRTRTFATQGYTSVDGQALPNHFEVLYPKWGSPSGVHPNLHEKLKSRVTAESLSGCFGRKT